MYCMCIHTAYTHVLREAKTSPIRLTSDAHMANPPTNIVDVRGFDSSIISILRGGIPRPIWSFPESLSRAMLVGVMLVGRLGVPSRFLEPCSTARLWLWLLSLVQIRESCGMRCFPCSYINVRKCCVDIYIYIYTYMYVHTYRERERDGYKSIVKI